MKQAIKIKESQLKQIISESIENILFEYRVSEPYPSKPHRYGFKDSEFQKKFNNHKNKLKSNEHERIFNNIIKYISQGLQIQQAIDIAFVNRDRLKKITINDFANTLTSEEIQIVKDAVKKNKQNKTESEKYYPIIIKELNKGKQLEQILLDLNITEDYLNSILSKKQKENVFFLSTRKYSKKLY